MIHANHRKTLLEMLSLPTAPFVEGAVVAYVERFCRARPSLTLRRDRSGNLLVHLRRGRRRVRRPICLTAHLDHPGFIAEKMIGPKRLRAIWRGGVRPEYFIGSGVRFHADGKWTRGRVRSISQYREGGIKRVSGATIEVAGAVPPGAPGMWALPDASIRGRRLYSRASDDLSGAAAMLCCIEEMTRRRLEGEAYFLFSRAEEVGFVGAMAAARSRTIPKRCIVVVVENSSELSFARMGDGPVLRVGDKMSVFHPPATDHCGAVAAELAKSDGKFVYQRKLMDGGSCEATAYAQLGYEGTCICLALGNYHNMDTKRKRVALEYVDTHDVANLIKWFVALARNRPPYTGRNDALRKRLDGISRQYRKVLGETRQTPIH